jgi:hypothetical protein
MCNSKSSNASDSDSDSEEYDANVEYIRAKWTYDGARNLNEIIDKLNDQIEYIKKLKEDGWELIAPVNDDYGPMKKS